MDSNGRRTCRRIALQIQYDGTNFNGWQIQPTGRTVQASLNSALSIILNHSVSVTASGRTDSGVHALCQIVHFDTESDISLNRIVKGGNGILDEDVSIVNAYEVGNDFHSRYSTIAREYIYMIYNSPSRSPFTNNRYYWVRNELDVGRMEKACSHIIGRHDFASFCKKTSGEESGTIRDINFIDIKKNKNIINLKINGTAFLHNQIRTIVGTLVDLQKNNHSPQKMKEILEKKERIFAGPTAPPCGLYLNNVFYQPDLHTYKKAF